MDAPVEVAATGRLDRPEEARHGTGGVDGCADVGFDVVAAEDGPLAGTEIDGTDPRRLVGPTPRVDLFGPFPETGPVDRSLGEQAGEGDDGAGTSPPEQPTGDQHRVCRSSGLRSGRSRRQVECGGHAIGDLLAFGGERTTGVVGGLVDGAEAGAQRHGRGRSGTGPDDHVGRSGVPAGGLGEGREHAGVVGGGVHASGAEYEPHGDHGVMVARDGPGEVPGGVPGCARRGAVPGCARRGAVPGCARRGAVRYEPPGRISLRPKRVAGPFEPRHRTPAPNPGLNPGTVLEHPGEPVEMHPELVSEQKYLDDAYTCLLDARERAIQLKDMVEVGRGGTNQARSEREAIWEAVAARLNQLDMGDAALVFGRIDQDEGSDGESGDRFYIGRVGVWDEEQEPVVVDWRAPIAEAFYRATGRMPMGLERRRHFVSRGRELVAIEDELFGDVERFREPGGLRGQGALIAALETARTGRLGDIVGTIQAEQDLIIRAPLAGVLAVQGGPGTGKTVVALHRAAYLLYTNRFPLEGQGVLVVGPNRLFLAYIEQVLPSLGEAGIELATLSDIVRDTSISDRHDAEEVSRLKGDLRMVRFLSRAVRTRQRPLRDDLRVGYGVRWLRITVDQTQRIVTEARRRFRTHNAARRFVEDEFFRVLTASARSDLEVEEVRENLQGKSSMRLALDWMWPVLSPSELLNDLFGSRALIRAAGPSLTDDEVDALHRQRSAEPDGIRWSASDAPLLDEVRSALGARPGSGGLEAVRTYGHIVIDEVQDLSPMGLRMLERRSLNGSMTVVGDIAQATGAWAHDGWASILDHLPKKRLPQRYELTVGYRIPGPLMGLAARVLAVAAPDLKPPVAVRDDGGEPRFVEAAGGVAAEVARIVAEESAAVEPGNLAVIVAASQVDEVESALEAAGIEFGRPNRHGLDASVAVVPVSLVKGLEVDAAVVVEPSRIVAEQVQGLRALYVALTRATQRVSIVHAEPLPEVLED